MPRTKVAISGASSFTGCWIANYLAKNGFEVHALYSRPQTSYTELVEKRVLLNRDFCVQHFSIDAIDQSIVTWIRNHKPEIWIHHHHWTQNFKSPHFDKTKALKVGLEPLKEIVVTLSQSRCRGVIYSGSFYENLAPASITADIEPYTDSKLKVQRRLEELCPESKLLLSKVFIPNAIGPLENPNRLIPTLISLARIHSSLKLLTPHALTALYPVIQLGPVYAELIASLLKGIEMQVSPIGESHSVLDWSKKISQDFLSQILQLTIDVPGSFEDLITINQFDWEKVWQHYARFELPA